MFTIYCANCGCEIAQTPNKDLADTAKDEIFCSEECANTHAGDIPDDSDDEEKDGSENAEETAEEKGE